MICTYTSRNTLLLQPRVIPGGERDEVTEHIPEGHASTCQVQTQLEARSGVRAQQGDPRPGLDKWTVVSGLQANTLVSFILMKSSLKGAWGLAGMQL